MSNRGPVYSLLAVVLVVGAIGYYVHDFYLTLALSYLAALTLSLFFWRPGGFLMLERMEQLWDERSQTVRAYVVEGCTHQPPSIVHSSPEAMLDDANLFNEAKFKYLLNETRTFVPRVTDDLRTLVFVNTLLLIALVIAVSDTTSAATTPVDLGSPPPAVKTEAERTAEATLLERAGTGEVDLVSSRPQPLRHLLSYMAIAIQLAWFIRLLFHYRQKNVEIVSAVGSPEVPDRVQRWYALNRRP